MIYREKNTIVDRYDRVVRIMGTEVVTKDRRRVWLFKAGFVFQNVKRELKNKKNSTGVGVQIIKNIMKKMGDRCRIIEENDMFRIEIVFSDAN